MRECREKQVLNLWKPEQALTHFELEKQLAGETIERERYIKLRWQGVREGMENYKIRKSRKSKNTYLL